MASSNLSKEINEIDNFEKAKATCLADVKEKHKDDAKEWLRSQDTAQEAQSMCRTLNDQGEAQYSSKGSVSIAGHSVFPKKIITKLLDNINTFVSVGDFALKGGPESVGLVWTGVKIVLGSLQQDYKNCVMFADCFTDIVGIFVSCRLYSKLYHSSKGDTEVSSRMHTDIQKMYVDILEFSFAVKRHFHHGRAKVIKAHLEKMIGSARDSFQEWSTNFYQEWRGSQSEVRESMQALQMGMEFMQKMMTEIAEERRVQKEKERLMKLKSPLELAQEECREHASHLNQAAHLEWQKHRPTRTGGTCKWIFGQEEYQTWQDSEQNNMLWISGTSGSGKSTLLTTVVEALQTEVVDTLVLYFFCKTGAEETSSPRKVMQNFCFQLLEACQELLEDLKACNEMCRKAFKTPPSASGGKPKSSYDGPDPYKLFKELATIPKLGTIIVLDAIDECVQDEQDQFAHELFKTLAGDEFRVKLLVASSEEPIESEAYPNVAVQTLSVQRHNGKDIHDVVSQGLAKVPGLSPSERTYAIETIANKAQGIFAAIESGLRFFHGPWQRPIEDALEKLPKGGEDVYQRAFEQLNPGYLELAKTCLSWTVLAERDLKVDEIMDVYTRRFMSDDRDDLVAETSKEDLQIYTEQVLRSCGPFVEVAPSSRAVRLKHPSIKDFFLKEQQIDDSTPPRSPGCTCPRCVAVEATSKKYVVSPKFGHLAIAKTLLQHLNSSHFQQQYLGANNEHRQEDCSDEGGNHETDTEGDEENKARVDEANADNTPSTQVNATDDIKLNEAEDAPTDTNSKRGLLKEGNAVEGARSDAGENEEEDEDDGGNVEDDEDDEDAEDDENAQAGEDGEDEEDEKEEADEEEDAEGDLVQVKGLEGEEDVQVPEGSQDEGSDESDDDDSDDSDDSTELAFTDNEDGFDAEEDEVALERAEAWEGEDSAMEPRYEAVSWLLHLKQAEDLWPESERQSNSDWQEVLRLLDSFMNSEVFQAWQQQHWETDENIPMDWWEEDETLNPLHVAVAYSLTGLVKRLLKQGKYKVCDSAGVSGETVLHIAAKVDEVSVPILELLFEHAADPEMPNLQNDTVQTSPFHFLLMHDSCKESVECFLKHGARCTIPDDSGYHPLHYFAQYGMQPHILDVLLAAGADVNAADYHGETPLHKLCGRDDLPLDLLAAFLKAGANPNAEDTQSQRPLYEVSMAGNLEAATTLVDFGADIGDPDYLGMTALHMAAFAGHTKIVQMLVSRHAFGNELDENKRTPLLLACTKDGVEAASVLLEAMADLPFASVNVRDKNGKTPLRKASRYGLAGIVEQLLNKEHTMEELNAKDSVVGIERTALHAAAYNGHLEVVNVLLGAGADSRLLDGDGKTPLDLALEGWLRGNRDSSEATILRLIEEDVPSAMEDAELLCSAAMQGSLPVLRKLLEDPKADPNLKDEHGWTPLLIARQYSQKEAADFLSQR